MILEPLSSRPPRYWSLDIFRGICALTVFFNHWPLWSHFAPAGPVESCVHGALAGLYRVFVPLFWPTGGQHPAVIGFFVLSGFCVHLPFEWGLGQADGAPDWRGYFRQRIRRIMPVYWVGVLLGVAVVGLERWHPSGDPLLQLHAAASPLQIMARLGGWSALWPEEIFAGNYPLHTVGTEIVIYVAYPLFFLAAAAGRWWLLGAVAVGLQLLTLPLLRYVDAYVLFPGLLMMGLFWYLGALAAHLVTRRAWRVRGVAVGMVWALFLVLQQTPHFYGLTLLKQLVWGLVCMGGIAWLIGWEQRHQAWRDHAAARILRWTGDISYPLYAVHTPVILLANWALLALGSRSYAWQLTLNLALPFLVTLLVHHGIERRCYRPRVAP